MTRAAFPVPFRFLLVGLANSTIGLSIIFLLKWQGGSDITANVFGYATGLIVSFALNRQWTFDHSGSVLPAAWRFLLVFAIAYVANLLTLLALVRLVQMNAYAAQVLGVPPYTAIFYVGSRYFAFRGRSD
jgi:putative flippase GtrA